MATHPMTFNAVLHMVSVCDYGTPTGVYGVDCGTPTIGVYGVPAGPGMVLLQVLCMVGAPYGTPYGVPYGTPTYR